MCVMKPNVEQVQKLALSARKLDELYCCKIIAFVDTPFSIFRLKTFLT